MDDLQHAAILVLLVTTAFTAGFMTKDLSDKQLVLTATQYVERANRDLDDIRNAHSHCTSEQALAWWTNSGDLDKVRHQLCSVAVTKQQRK